MKSSKLFVAVGMIVSMAACTQEPLDTTCELDIDGLFSTYQINKTLLGSAHHDEEREQTAELHLIRRGDAVAHHYPQIDITESWELVNGDLVKPYRHFDKHQRTIEFMPNEMIHGKVDNDWGHRYQLITEKAFSLFKEVDRNGSQCEHKVTYEYEDGNGNQYELTWMPGYRLVTEYFYKGNSYEESWELKDYRIDPEQADEFFAQRSQYQSTDFADIGDDHTDPFLTQMVDLGFIEHGASGFYDADGNPIGKGHSH